MIFKKKEFFLLIFLVFLQSCSGGTIGNFLESSFNDLEKKSLNQDLQNNLVNKKIKKVENPKNVPENKQDINLEKIPKQKNNKIKNLSKKEKLSFNLTK